jgi:hypothetical protein
VAAGIEIFQFFGHSPRFARVAGAVKAVAARAPSSPCLGRKIVIEFLKKSVKAGFAKKVLVQRGVSHTLACTKRQNKPSQKA